jgi:hypothetical protein
MTRPEADNIMAYYRFPLAELGNKTQAPPGRRIKRLRAYQIDDYIVLDPRDKVINGAPGLANHWETIYSLNLNGKVYHVLIVPRKVNDKTGGAYWDEFEEFRRKLDNWTESYGLVGNTNPSRWLRNQIRYAVEYDLMVREENQREETVNSITYIYEWVPKDEQFFEALAVLTGKETETVKQEQEPEPDKSTIISEDFGWWACVGFAVIALWRAVRI